MLPYRRRHPTYQRRWRLTQRLREIREETSGLLHRIGGRVCAVVAWGKSLVALSTLEATQIRSITGESLRAALASAGEFAELVEQAAALAAKLDVCAV